MYLASLEAKDPKTTKYLDEYKKIIDSKYIQDTRSSEQKKLK